MLGGNRLGRLVAALALATLMVAHRPAAAGDRVTDLTSNLSSSSEKTRLSAVLALARLGDKRVLKPLVTALQDPNPQIRAIAATALGKLGHKGALPALKTAATDDVDDTVRKTARDAVLAVSKKNNIESDLAAAPVTSDPVPQARKTTTGFGRSPHAVVDRTDLYVTVQGCNDNSPGATDKPTRKSHGDILATVLKDSLRTARQVTTVENDAQRWGIEQRQLDVSVVKLEAAQVGNYMEVAVELRLAISDNTGKMLSFLSGGAKVQVPMSKYRPTLLPNMRKEALEGALRGLFDKLLVHLRHITTT
jgi:hypothetical protein